MVANRNIRKIVVALDASPCSRAVLSTAARLSAALDAELEGLFVEDANLLAAADLALAREVSYSGKMRALSRPRLETDYRCLAREVERWATAIAVDHNPTWRFRVARGDVARALMDAAGQEDLLCLGRYGHPICPSSVRLGSVARRVMEEHQAPILLLHQEIPGGGPVIVIDGDAGSPLLALAGRMARTYESRLIVLTDSPQAAARLRAELAERATVHVLTGQLSIQIQALAAGQLGTVLSRRRLADLGEMEHALLLL